MVKFNDSLEGVGGTKWRWFSWAGPVLCDGVGCVGVYVDLHLGGVGRALVYLVGRTLRLLGSLFLREDVKLRVVEDVRLFGYALFFFYWYFKRMSACVCRWVSYAVSVGA